MSASLEASLLEAKDLIREIAGPMPPGSKVKEMLRLVNSKTKLGFRRLRGFWYGEARTIQADEMDVLRGAARERAARGSAQPAAEVDLQHAFERIQARLEILERRTASVDPDVSGAPQNTESGSRTRAGGAFGALGPGEPRFAG